MIVWGGSAGSSGLNTGGRYDPGTDNWTATSTTSAPDGRAGHTAVWTGSEMKIGRASCRERVNTGGGYKPDNDSWTATSTTSAPAPRDNHTAVWTGRELN